MKVIIVGCGRVGARLARQLDAEGHTVAVVDQQVSAFDRLGREFRGNMIVGNCIDEAVLRRPIGGSEVMREQVEYLIKMAEHPAVTLQSVPFRVGGHSAAGGPFSILRFAEPELSDVVYLEQLTSALYIDKPTEVDRYLEVMERLCVQAETAADTSKVLEKIHDQMPY